MLDYYNLDKLPPVLILRKTQFEDVRIEEKYFGGQIRMLARDVPMRTLLAVAYDFKLNGDFFSVPTRLVLPPDLTTNRFDLMLGLTNQPQFALQTELKSKLGLVAHREVRETDLLVLKKTATWKKAASRPTFYPWRPQRHNRLHCLANRDLH